METKMNQMIKTTDKPNLNKKIIFSGSRKEVDYESDPHGEVLYFKAKVLKGELIIRNSSFQRLKVKIVDNWGRKISIDIEERTALVNFNGETFNTKTGIPFNADHIIDQEFNKLDFINKDDIINVMRELFEALVFNLKDVLSFDTYIVSASLEFLSEIIYYGDMNIEVKDLNK